MGAIESTGGRKWWLAAVPIGTLCVVLVIEAIRGHLSEGLLVAIGGIITALKGLFDWSNTANNKAALEAGKAKDEETARLDALPDRDVLAAAGAERAVDAAVDGAAGELRAGTARARRAASAAARGAIDRLRKEARQGV